MKKQTFTVKQRSLEVKPKEIRSELLVPGNIYGPKMDSIPVQFPAKKFRKLFSKVGEVNVAYIQLDEKEIPAMIEEVQFDPVTDDFIHVSFKAVDLTKKVESEIPVELEGEFEVPEAVLVTVRDHIEVEALPTDLPEKFVIDVSNLTEIGQSITLADLKYNQDKIEIVVGEEGEEAPIVLVQEVKEEVEEEEEIETEIIGEKDVEEEAEEKASTEKEPTTEEKAEE